MTAPDRMERTNRILLGFYECRREGIRKLPFI